MNARIAVISLTVLLAVTGCGGKVTTNKLLEDLNSKEEGDRVKAVRLLQTRDADPAKVVPALVKSLSDKHADVRRSAAIGLGGMGANAKDAIPDLQKVAEKDRDRRVRDSATVAISRIEGGDKEEKKENASKP